MTRLKKLLSIVLAMTLMLSLSVGAMAEVPNDHAGTVSESQGLTESYIKVADGVYVRDSNAPTTRYIPEPACYDCGSTRFVTAKNTFLANDKFNCCCPIYYNGHACYYCGTRYVDEQWMNHKASCEYQ